MKTISTLISQKEYTKIISEYLMKKNTYKVVATLLIFIIVYSSINAYFHADTTNFQVLTLWWGLTLAYIILIPALISHRTKVIYNNTEFLHYEMKFSFDQDKIIWETKVGTREIAYKTMYSSESTKSAIILAFSPYQVLAIPYKDISLEDWEHITTVLTTSLKKRVSFKIKHYQKYSQNS